MLGNVGAPPPLVRRLWGASLLLWLLPGLVGAPSPFVHLLVGAPLPIAVPLLCTPVLRALSREVAVVPPARFVLGLPCCLLLGLPALMCPLCGVRRVLCCLALRRSSSLIGYVCFCVGCCATLLCCWLGSAFAHARACGPSCAPCVTARGRFAAYCGAAACRYPVPWAVFPVRCVATCSAACGAPLWVMPGLVGAPLPLVRLLVGAHLPFALPSLTAPRLCELTFEAPPPAPLLVGLLRLSRLGLLALSGPLSNVPWALC